MSEDDKNERENLTAETYDGHFGLNEQEHKVRILNERQKTYNAVAIVETKHLSTRVQHVPHNNYMDKFTVACNA